MKRNFMSRKKFIIMLLLLTVIIIGCGLGISRFKDPYEDEDEEETNIYIPNTINYTIIQNEIRENISSQVKEEQKVVDLIISNTKIVYTNEKSKLTADIKNTSSDINDLKIKVIFLGNDLKIITEKEFEVGDIKTDEIKNISIVLQNDVSNTNIVKYEIM